MHILFYFATGDKSPLAAGTPRHRADGEGTFPHPSPLRKRLQSVADAALAAGITLPMHTTFEVIRSSAVSGDGVEGHGGGEGMDFIVSVIPTEALEAKVRLGMVAGGGEGGVHICCLALSFGQ